MKYQLIEATINDIDLLVNYQSKNVLDWFSLDTTDKKQLLHDLLEKTKQYQSQFRIIMANGEKVGCLLYYPYQDGIFIDEIYLLPNYRNCGIGSHILNTILIQHSIAYLYVYQVNKKAIQLYQSLGFMTLETTNTRLFMRYEKHQSNFIGSNNY